MAIHRSFESLAKKLGKFANNIEDSTEVKVRAISNKIVEHLAHRTPKLTGRATYAWQVKINSAPASSNIGKRDNPPVDASTCASELINRGKAVTSGFNIPVHNKIFIVNYLDYMQYLDRGWSDKAPANFIMGCVVAGVAGTRHIRIELNPKFPNVLG